MDPGAEGSDPLGAPPKRRCFRMFPVSRLLPVAVFAVSSVVAAGGSAAGFEGEAIVARECASCHNITGPPPRTFEALLSRKAPDLFYAGSKFNRPWLVEWLQNPTPIRAAGVMYLNHLALERNKDGIAVDTVESCPVKLDPDRAEAVAAYLMSLKDATMKAEVVDPHKKFNKAKALRLFRKQQPCVACHTIRWGKKLMGGVSGPSLTDAGNRLNPDWVYARIENPQHWDPKTWMPRVEMSHKKRELLTLFIGSMRSPTDFELDDLQAALPGAAIPLGAFVTPNSPGHGNAEQNYRLFCVQCHGSQGTGQGINDTVGGLSVSPKNHVSAKEMSQLSDEELRLAVTKGGDAVQKSGLMPAWGRTLSPQDIDGLVLYLRALCRCEAGT